MTVFALYKTAKIQINICINPNVNDIDVILLDGMLQHTTCIIDSMNENIQWLVAGRETNRCT